MLGSVASHIMVVHVLGNGSSCARDGLSVDRAHLGDGHTCFHLEPLGS